MTDEPSAAPLAVTSAGRAGPRAGIRVLIGEDEDPLRDALTTLLDCEPGLDVIGALADADAAIQAAQELQPDVVMIDVRIPGGGGARVARAVNAGRPATRVLALSAYEDLGNVLEMLTAGAVGYLVKGTAPEEIIEAVRRASRGQASLSAALTSDLIHQLVRDVEQHREAEVSSRRNEERFRGLLNSAPDATVVFGADGRMELVNEQTETIFGYARDEMLGQHVEMLLPERLRERHVGHRAAYFADPSTRPMGVDRDLAGLRKDGSEFPIEITLSSIETEGGRIASGRIRGLAERKEQTEPARSVADRRALLGRLVSASEEERQRIAGEIHDDSIQVITAAGMRLQILRRRLDDPEHLALLDTLEETIELSIGRLRHLLFELHPPALDSEGLTAALRMYLDEAVAQSSIDYSLDDRLNSQPCEQTRLILYRIAQEVLTNVRKHSQAHTATVVVESSGEGYLVRVADDGVGFSAEAVAAVPGHIGLAGIRERAELSGGWLRINSGQGLGTAVEFWIPEFAETEDANGAGSTNGSDGGAA